MSIISKSTACSTLLFIFIFSSTSYASNTESRKSIAFTDPNHVAKIKEGFTEQAIQYDKKVASDVDVVISLGQQTYPAFHKIVEELAVANGIKVNIQQGTCGATSKKLVKKSVDIGTFCCPPGATDRLPGLKFHTIAVAPITLVTHKDNPISDISSEDAKKIFRGEYVSWSEVPNNQNLSDKLKCERIQPVVRLHCKKRPGHWRLLLKGPDNVSPRASSVGTIPDMVSVVASNTAAIGYETPFMLKVHKNKGELKKLSIDGHKADDLSILLQGNYPVYRTYNMTTWTNENNVNEKAKLLLDKLYNYVQEHGEEYGFIPAAKLKSAGWIFKDKELIAEPDNTKLISEH